MTDNPKPNCHIKTINGRQYWYQTVRKGKKVTSKYLAPVWDRKRKKQERFK